MAIIYLKAKVQGKKPEQNPIDSFEFDLPHPYRFMEDGQEFTPFVDAWECEGKTENGIFTARYKDAYRMDTLESIPTGVLRTCKLLGVNMAADAECILADIEIEVA